LKKRGTTSGQVLAILLPNIPEFAVTALGAIEAGLVVTTINPVYTPCTQQFFILFFFFC
jgi:acyl-CoA synthetase (AMP-forming)/AMP-acid ligase II